MQYCTVHCTTIKIKMNFYSNCVWLKHSHTKTINLAEYTKHFGLNQIF